jgi:ubiquitin C-terminal hydrolase
MDWDADGAKKKIISRKRYATGLGNLGNTCFMNSTLQCLAHTDPLRKYFLSGEYEKELNKHNTLGTGGELASQFASLLAEMWGVQLKRRNVLGNAGSTYSSPDSAVYPRNFKHTLGKHAEQFVGYDQHDSQELATYLLDALHEDTNRVTQKPYIEKPEQGEDETDEIAAEKAWNLHLQREDSRVLDSFMGQVKSRVQCCEATCSRVSTTFDPFMFLSVPVPGSTDRELNVTFVPLHAGEEILNLNLILPKSATIKVMLQQLGKDLVAKGFRKEKIPVEDLCAVDVWRHDVYKWYTEDEEVDRIRDSDKTYIYELRSLKETNGSEDQDAVDGNCSAFNELRLKQRAFKCKLDVETLTSLNKDDEWMDTLAKYVRNPTQVLTVLNAARSTTEDRARFHKKLEDFIDACYLKFSGDESTGQKRARDEDPESETVPSVSEDNNVPGLVQVSDASEVFQGVSIQKDLAILEFCSSKLRQYAKELEKEKVERRSRGGVCIQAGTERQSGPFGGRPASSEVLMFPLVLRIPSNMTVYQLRNELAARYRIFDENSEESNLHGMNGMEIEHEPSKSPTESEDKALCLSVKDAFLQMPLLYKKKTAYSYRPQGEGSCQLGMLSGDESDHESTTADPRNEAERVNVFDTVGLHGSVTLKLPSHVNHKGLCVDNPIKNVRGATDENAQKVITVKDCIDKYCQKEQLEDTEMWYCNKCQKHVRAWKQFHLYRLPPILIVHLKRFHYSSSTHRRDKIGAFVDFPLKGLDLSDLVSHWKDGERPVYDCYAVSNHYGGLGGG